MKSLSIDKIQDIKNRIDKLRVGLDTPSDMEIYGIERRELSHSHILAYIFKTTYKYGSIESLLWLIKDKDLSCHACKETLDNVDLHNVVIDKLEVDTEVCVDKNRRCDIVMMVTFGTCPIQKIRIVIENKVYAKEGDDQTLAYYSHFSCKSDPAVYLFLTPVNDEQKCACEEFIHITYQDLYDKILQPLSESDDIDSKMKALLKSYIKSLGLPTQYSNKRKIMALDNELKMEIENFFNEYGAYISDMLDILNADTNDTKQAKSAKQSGVKISTQLKSGNGKLLLQTLVCPLIEKIAVRNNVKSYNEICNLFPQRLVAKRGSAHLIYNKDMLKNINDKYGERFPIKVYDQEYYILIYSQAWKDHRDHIIEYMENHPEYFNSEEIAEMSNALKQL